MASKDHARVVQEKEQRIRLLQTRITTLRKDFHKHVPIHKYAAELKVKETPSYIIILQAKLCREVHRMCAEETQLTLCKSTVKSLGKFCLKQVREMEQEQSQLELEVLNGMARLEVQQKELQEDDNEKVHQQRLQVVDIQKNFSEDTRAWENSGIDSIMDRLSILNTNLKRQTKPQDAEITLDDLKADRPKSSSLDFMLGEKKNTLHGSWSAAEDEMQDRNKGVKRRGSMFATSTWRSEKHEAGWR
jgi:type II secretory pathway component PulJ